MEKGKPVTVAMSGGVDSATTAAILQEAGYTVRGVYMKNWSEDFGLGDQCPWREEIKDVERVCKHLGIPWEVYNFEREYRDRVIDYFFAEYKAGRTPNPDVLCNNQIKFDLCWHKVQDTYGGHLATGHYARLSHKQPVVPWNPSVPAGLYTALDANKDQAYFLYRVPAERLAKSLFPLGSLYKSEVRVLAKHFGLPVAEKPDSQGICFIGEINVTEFLRENLGNKPGPIKNKSTGTEIGQHDGLWFYTIGQRGGIKVGGVNPPYYVVEKDVVNNILWVAQGRHNKWLQRKEVAFTDVHLQEKALWGMAQQKVTASLRYREDPQPATITWNEDFTAGKLRFRQQAWAPASGQSTVWYDGPVQPSTLKPVAKPEQILAELMDPQAKRHEQRLVQVLGGAIIA